MAEGRKVRIFLLQFIVEYRETASLQTYFSTQENEVSFWNQHVNGKRRKNESLQTVSV